MRLLLRGALLCATAAVSASEWVAIDAKKGTEGKTEIDLQSISFAKSYRKAWFKQTAEIDTVVPPEAATKTYAMYKSVVSLLYFNCAERTGATLQRLYYDKDQVFVGQTVSHLDPAAFTEVAPDTIGELEMQIVCSTPVKPSKATSGEGQK